MKLYWFWSFNPQKVRFALHELGLAHDLVAVDCSAVSNATRTLRASTRT
jgi:glutathione S-transferase